MYTQTEILNIARNCTTVDEVILAAKLFRDLVRDKLQESTPFISYVFVQRFREVM